MAFSIALQLIASAFLLKTAFRDPGTIPSRVYFNSLMSFYAGLLEGDQRQTDRHECQQHGKIACY